MDIPTIVAAAGGIKNAIDIAKFIKESGDSLGQAELKLKFADLISSLADAKMNVAEVKSVIEEKEEFIRQLQKELEIKGKIKYEAPYYWLDNEGAKDGPYCQKCYDSDKMLIRLQNIDRGIWDCHKCDKRVRDRSYVPANIRMKEENY